MQLTLFSCLLINLAFAQVDVNPDKFKQPPLHVKFTEEEISLDGIMDEEIWSQADVASNFFQYFPQDTGVSLEKTEVRMVYNDRSLYVAIKAYSTIGDNWQISSLRRDYRGPNNDGVTLVIDPFGNQNNAFIFGFTPFGVRREALNSNGGRERSDFNLSWDQVWRGESKIYDGEGYWIGEIEIPFKSLRYQGGKQNWKLNLYRLDTQANERSTWQRIPRNISLITLGFMGDMIFEKPLKPQKTNISLIPYTLGGITRNFDEETEANSKLDFGGDAKVSLGPSLNLDLTFNPDFSTVEVDRQVTDLDRFEIFFPERRQFFLENSDLFANLGSQRIRPFFSRRIGIAFDPNENTFVQNRILAGARLSGQLSDKWRLGLLNMQTARDEGIDLLSTNYSMATLQYQVLQRSNISGFMVNKQAIGEGSSDLFNRVGGIDFNHSSLDARWLGKTFLHFSQVPGQEKMAVAHGGTLGYQGQNLEFVYEHQYVAQDYSAEVGFVPRVGFMNASLEGGYNFWVDNDILVRYGFGTENSFTYDLESGEVTDRLHAVGTRLRFRNQSFLGLSVENNYTKLTFDFNATGIDSLSLASGTSYSYTGVNFFYFPDRRKKVYFEGQAYAGGYFNGKRYGVSGDLTLQFQPYGNLALATGVNLIRMPEPYVDANLLLIGPRLDLTFSRKLFWTTFLQFNSQTQRFDVNSRLQWRFKPVSDIFLVYTDRYDTNIWQTKNRGVVLKMTYWLNI